MRRLAPLAALLLAAPLAAQPAFTNVTGPAGVGGTYTDGHTHDLGIAWVDYNGDFWPDAFVSNGEGFDHYLYRNDGDGTFTDVSYLVPKPDLGLESAGARFADIDNDGDSDVLVVVDNPFMSLDEYNPPEGGPNLLYVNDGDGTFTEGALAAGLVDPDGHRTITGGFADYDRDGFVDVYLARWQLNNPDGPQARDRLLRNDGDGTFTDVTDVSRTDGVGRNALVVLWFDADMDLWPDLYVGHVGTLQVPPPDTYDVFYRNEHEGTRFCNRTGDPHVLGNDATAAMGMDVGDIDNDGDWDLYITDIASVDVEPAGNPLYLGSPDGTLSDNVADLHGVVSPFLSWPCSFIDVDRNGWTDLWVGTGPDFAQDEIYLNLGDGTFVKWLSPGFAPAPTRGGAVADYDGDGDMDIFQINHEANAVLYRNDTVTNGGYLQFRLFGVQSNRDAIGATVRVTIGGVTQMRRVSGGDSAHSQSEQILHFGIGTAADVDVSVTWPSGVVQQFADVPTNQLVFVDEAQGILAEQPQPGQALATWNAATEELTVLVRTNFGGRTSLDAAGFGPLGWNVEQLGHGAVFPGVPANPGTVTVTSASGGSWDLPVADA